VSESLRDRVALRLLTELTERDVPRPHHLAAELTAAVFDTMADARPCVTCGRGIGPAKVAKGYVQCYDCTRRRPAVT
jgi:hypothetical protein